MIDMERANLEDEINSVFRNGTILIAKDEKLQEYLRSLCSEDIPNDRVRHRETIRALTINHIQMQRHIDNLNRKNTWLQIVIIVLTIIFLFTAVIQIYTTVKYAQKSPLQTTQQAQPKQSGSKANITSEATTDDSSASSKPPYEKNK